MKTKALLCICFASIVVLLASPFDANGQLPITIKVNWVPPVEVPEGTDYSVPYAGFTSLDQQGRPYIRYNPNIYIGLPQVMLVFLRVHEYGHVILKTSNEADCDCWAAKQLKQTDPKILRDVIWFMENVVGKSGKDWTHGSGLEMAAIIRKCAEESDNEDEKNVESRSGRAKIPSPRHPGKQIGGVISDEKAEEYLDLDDSIRWDTNPQNPYAYYTVTLRNHGTQTLECLSRAMINLKSSETRKMVWKKWNVDEKRVTLKPGEIKTIKGKIQWYGDATVKPDWDYEILAMFAK